MITTITRLRQQANRGESTPDFTTLNRVADLERFSDRPGWVEPESYKEGYIILDFQTFRLSLQSGSKGGPRGLHRRKETTGVDGKGGGGKEVGRSLGLKISCSPQKGGAILPTRTAQSVLFGKAQAPILGRETQGSPFKILAEAPRPEGVEANSRFSITDNKTRTQIWRTCGGGI